MKRNLNLKGVVALLVALAVAVVIAFALVKSRKPLQHVAAEMPSRAVEVVTARLIPFRSSITAYGNVEPAITLNSTAEVSGRISYVHPNLKPGETIPAGTVVVRIEAKDYALSLQQTKEDLKASQSSLRELEAEQESTQRSLELAQKNLEVGEDELARLREIYQKQLIARSTLDAEEQKTIQLRQQVEDLQGRMNGYESRRQSIEAQIARAEQEVQNRTTILGRTEVGLPFDARIGAVSVDRNEFVAVGSPLFEAIDLKGVEISAQLPIQSMRRLVSHLANRTDMAQQFVQTGGRINESLGLTARVRLVNDMPEAVWDARVLRISDAIDATRQTLGVVVGVDSPYDKIIPGRRPPLIKGMYTAVDLFAPEQSALVLPRKAVHEGRVYIATAENRLEVRPVEITMSQGDLVVVRSGIEEGERIVVTDLIPVIEGMPLQVEEALEVEAYLRRRALGADE
ncbi:MAG: HlyD family secretion protein [Gammaproteobacteria bacterium]|nr:HlyD family secretion protein [Gammaproteobacteria bacterium]MDH3447546.1 HlyD family secretion protein [Gammaproteobacteria bacterium]